MEPSQEIPEKSHVLAIIFPLQGHINPAIQLCKRLVAEKIRVTLLTTASTSRTIQREGFSSDCMAIEIIPDINVVGEDNSDMFEVFFRDYKSSITHGVPQIIQKYDNTGIPVKAILYDSASPWIVDVAHANGVKGAVFFTQNCSVSSIFYHLHSGSLELPSDKGCGEILLPGLTAMKLKDLPSVAYDMNSYKAIRRHLIDQFETCGKAEWRLFNTFDKLEHEVLKWMARLYPILAIGPSIPSMYIDKRLQNNYEYGLNLSAPKAESCLRWLNNKQDHSVIYVSFGSLANLDQKQMEELAWGLTDSGCDFIWVVRDPEFTKLPQGFTSSPSKKGLIVKWCNQLEVLSHRAVGCFLTHCGWNSTLEALSLGVPMVAMPQWTDQTTNAKLVMDVWQTGVRAEIGEDGIVKKEEIVACVKEVMEGDKGKETRRNALKWKDLARDAISKGGSSDKNIMKFVMELVNSN
ncbi:UDP-glycosyltransferase 74E1-like [Primulina tabacum]|uniref:UDP-glycosyltransferase 74E1-like n=1 Tax=Primulina tabacum TaxID=48773 RepID=UPI003F59BA00